MPSSSATPAAATRPEILTQRLTLTLALASRSKPEGEALVRTLRELKNQIIGNKTKKLAYLGLGAVPKIVGLIADAEEEGECAAEMIVQAAAAVGSFACGVEDGARAVVEAGAVPALTRILSFPDEKVVDAGARSLRMIFQSKLAPKYDILPEKQMKFLLSLLNSENENVSELAATIISHSCEKNAEQQALCDAGALERLVNLLQGSLNQRDACLDAIATIVRNNSVVATKFAGIDNGRALGAVSELIQDRFPRTRLLACVCLIAIRHASPCYVQDLQTQTKLILVLVELLEEPGRAGDDAPFALSDLIAGKEELHKQAANMNAVEKLCNFLRQDSVHARRLQGILLVLAELCLKLEKCRCQLISLQGLEIIANALKHESADIRIAACLCLRSVSRSVKNLSAGIFSSEHIIAPLVQLLHDQSTSLQVAALRVICNVVIDFTTQKCVLIQNGGVTQLIQLSRSMDSTLRLNSVCALRNLMFIGDKIRKGQILNELTLSTLASLICDSEQHIQEQALALVGNLIDGCIDFIEELFVEDGMIINAVVRQLQSASSPEVCSQGMLVLTNIAAGEEAHKEAVMNYLVPGQADGCTDLFIIRLMQSKHNLLRTAAVWCIINLTRPGSPGSFSRIVRLQTAGIHSQIKRMVNDPFLDCKFEQEWFFGSFHPQRVCQNDSHV
ncbi:putative armadillo repeat-containing protein 8 [Iris pallida]|uniref:Armadillo repeat-containing protein 8 n=1 Tax=Iris pallida TaxID=29817 RepID=A0AAX6H1N2_IRIPA|nr:putative armadillo repeat-containing protein 8 [Iris pallida]